jgi:hypothetical protein
MNQLSITLGVSVIVLALAAPGPAEAGVLGGQLGELPQTEATTVKVQANVRANADLPLALPSKGSHRGSGTSTSVKAKGEAQSTGSGVGAGLNGQAGGGAGGLAAHAALEQNTRAKGIVRVDGAGAASSTTGHGSAKLDARHHGRVSAKSKGHAAVKRPDSLAKPRWSAPGGGETKDVVPLRGIGREVGNPVQLGLAGWLIALAGAACLGASRIVRRLQHPRL